MALYAIRNGVASSSCILNGYSLWQNELFYLMVKIYYYTRRHGRAFFLRFANLAEVAKPRYLVKSVEAKLGLPERPKKPCSPYLDFIKNVAYPEVSKMNPTLKLLKGLS